MEKNTKPKTYFVPPLLLFDSGLSKKENRLFEALLLAGGGWFAKQAALSAQAALQIAQGLGLARAEQRELFDAARMLDVGLPALCPQLFGAEAPQEEGEEPAERMRIRLRNHPVLGARTARDFGMGPLGVDGIASHHEYWNGSGYPQGLREEAIPLGARILGVASTWAALLLPAPPQRRQSAAEAEKNLEKLAGLVLDPSLVSLFLAARHHFWQEPESPNAEKIGA